MKSALFHPTTLSLLLLLGGCSMPVTEHDLTSPGVAPGPPALLEAKGTWTPHDIDGRPTHAQATADNGFWMTNVFKLTPGAHRLGYNGSESAGLLYPKEVEFIAKAGGHYIVHLDLSNHRESRDGIRTLYFNAYSAIIKGKDEGVVAKAATAPFDTPFDSGKRLLLYDDVMLPPDRTALIRCDPGSGLSKAPVIFAEEITGRAGDTVVRYARHPYKADPAELRLLPGEYTFKVTLEGGRWRLDTVQSGMKTLTLHAEAGHTYLLKTNVVAGQTNLAKDALGGTSLTTAFAWEPSFEDVTARNPGQEPGT